MTHLDPATLAIAGLTLAGGQAKRLRGADKGLLEFGDRPDCFLNINTPAELAVAGRLTGSDAP